MSIPNLRLSAIHATVRAGHGEPACGTARGQPSAHIFKLQHSRIARNPHGTKSRTGRKRAAAVTDTFCFAGQTASHLLFPLWMNVGVIADVNRHRHSGIGKSQRRGLHFAQKCETSAGTRRICAPGILRKPFPRCMTQIRRKLNIKKRQMRIFPLPSPILDQPREPQCIFFRLGCIRLALIPDYPPDRKHRPRRNHATKNRRRHVMLLPGNRIRTATRFRTVRNKLHLPPPSPCQRQTLLPATEVQLFCGSREPSLPRKVDHPNSDHIASRPDSFRRDRIATRDLPVGTDVGTSCADLYAIEPCLVAVINGSEREEKFFSPPPDRQFDLFPVKDGSVDLLFNRVSRWNGNGFPALIMECSSLPFRELSTVSLREKAPLPRAETRTFRPGLQRGPSACVQGVKNPDHFPVISRSKRGLADPRFNPGSAPIAADQADRDLELLPELTAEVEPDRTEVRNCLRRADLP